jgi:protein required for attachment to host cells
MTTRGTMIERTRPGSWWDGARARLFAFSDHDAALVPVDFWLSPDAERLAGEAEAHRIAAAIRTLVMRAMRRSRRPIRISTARRLPRRGGERINQACAEGTFDQLILVAPATALGTLRHDLSPAVHERIKSELAQDLTKIPDHALVEHLARDLPIPLHAPRR